MFKFGKFKTSFNVHSGRRKGKHEEVSYGSSVTGAYRISANEFYVNGNFSEAQKKVKRTNAVTTPPAPAQPDAGSLRKTRKAPEPPVFPTQPRQGSLRQTKSTSDLIKENNLPPNLREAQSGVSIDPRGPGEARRNSKGVTVDPTNNKRQLDAHKRVEKKRLEEQKKLEKQRLEEERKIEKQKIEEQKKRQKLVLQEQTKQDKLRKEKEKREAQQLNKVKKSKGPAPQRPLANPLAQSNPALINNPASHSTNTLSSSISNTSGPPPYSEASNQERIDSENQSNVQFSKPIDTGSWDMVTQHRNIVTANRPVKATQPAKGQTSIDLNYTLGKSKSDA